MSVPDVPYSSAGLSISKAAHRLAARFGHQTNSGHLLLAIVNEADCQAARILRRHKFGHNKNSITAKLILESGPIQPDGISEDLGWTFTVANYLAAYLHSDVEPEHLLCGSFYRLGVGTKDMVWFYPQSHLVGARILRDLDVDLEALRGSLLPEMAKTFIRRKVAEKR